MTRWGRFGAGRRLPAGWHEDVLAAGVIVQDGDDTVPQDVAEQRFDAFIALLDQVRGDEDDEVLRTLLRCLRPQDDYGAYERLFGRLEAFPPGRRGRVTAQGLPQLARENPDAASVVVRDLARSGSQARAAFARSARRLPTDQRREVARFVVEEAGDVWPGAEDLAP